MRNRLIASAVLALGISTAVPTLANADVRRDDNRRIADHRVDVRRGDDHRDNDRHVEVRRDVREVVVRHEERPEIIVRHEERPVVVVRSDPRPVIVVNNSSDFDRDIQLCDVPRNVLATADFGRRGRAIESVQLVHRNGNEFYRFRIDDPSWRDRDVNLRVSPGGKLMSVEEAARIDCDFVDRR